MKALLTQCLLTLADTYVGQGGVDKYSDAQKLRAITAELKPEVLISQLAGLLLEKGVQVPKTAEPGPDDAHVAYVLGSTAGFTYHTAPAERGGYTGPPPAQQYCILGLTKTHVLELMAYAGLSAK